MSGGPIAQILAAQAYADDIIEEEEAERDDAEFEYNVNEAPNEKAEADPKPQDAAVAAEIEAVIKAAHTQVWTPATFELRHQLHRKNFVDRIRIEGRIRASCWQLMLFFCMFSSYLICIMMYDPIQRISRVHRGLSKRYKFSDLQNIARHEDIMAYLQTFFETSYDMASALVDANTLDSFSFERCFSSGVDDICRLKYWSTPLHEEAENYVNRTSILDDRLSPDNFFSVIACNRTNNRTGCIDWDAAVDPNRAQKTYGLTPEDPIIMENRMNYSLHSVVVLTPVIWQTRSKVVACSGFGDTYNDDVLGAGNCKEEEPCHPDRVTWFENSHPAARTGRLQRIYLTYDSPAFTCVDDKQEECHFMDRSWSPFADRRDLVEGVEAQSTEFEGRTVFYKFVSDTAWMQAPILGEILMPMSDPCAGAEWCTAEASDNASCVDPLTRPEHPVWQQAQDAADPDAPRRCFNQRYLSTNPSQRMNTWLTYETSQLSVAALVVTPQRDAVPDIITIIRVDFKIDIDGFISVTESLTSTSETEWWWYLEFAITLFFTALSFLEALEWKCGCSVIRRCCGRRAWSRHLKERKRHEDLFQEEIEKRKFTAGCDMFVAALTTLHISAVAFLDSMPPNETKELREAFDTNASEQYFKTITRIMIYQRNLDVVKLVGFLVVLIQFLRLCLYMTLHPRLAVLADTMIKSSDDGFHFIIYFLLTSFVLGLLGHWAFGQAMQEHETLSATLWTQFQMFTGTITFAPRPQVSSPTELAYAAYMVIYIVVVFIMLLNFLLAIVVNGYTVVQEHVQQNFSEKNFVVDVADLIFHSVYEHLMKWPDAYCVWRYLADDGAGLAAHVGTLPAVTAVELYQNVYGPDGEKAFASVDHAQLYINVYARKVWGEDSAWSLMESRQEKLFPPGEGYVPQAEDMVVSHIKSRRAIAKDRVRQAKMREFLAQQGKLHDLKLFLEGIETKVEQVFHHAHTESADGPWQQQQQQKLQPMRGATGQTLASSSSSTSQMIARGSLPFMPDSPFAASAPGADGLWRGASDLPGESQTRAPDGRACRNSLEMGTVSL